MLRTRCPYCGRPFSISREEAGAILAQALAENARYGMRECPFCRRQVKIGLAELRRAAPAPVASPAPPHPAEPAAAQEAEAVPPQALSGDEPSPPVEAPTEPPRRRRGKRTAAGEGEAPAPRARTRRGAKGSNPD